MGLLAVVGLLRAPAAGLSLARAERGVEARGSWVAVFALGAAFRLQVA